MYLFITSRGVRDGEQEPYRGSLPSESSETILATKPRLNVADNNGREELSNQRDLAPGCYVPFSRGGLQQPVPLGERKLTMVSVDFVGSRVLKGLGTMSRRFRQRCNQNDHAGVKRKVDGCHD